MEAIMEGKMEDLSFIRRILGMRFFVCLPPHLLGENFLLLPCFYGVPFFEAYELLLFRWIKRYQKR